MGSCISSTYEVKSERTYNVNSRELNNASKRLVPYENIYGYKTTKYDKKPGDVSAEVVEHLENTFKKRYLQYAQYDLRLKNIQEMVANYVYVDPKKYDDTKEKSLEAAIEHIDFAFGKCLFDKDLNKNNQFKYTDEEKYNIYKDIRGIMLEKYGFSLER